MVVDDDPLPDVIPLRAGDAERFIPPLSERALRDEHAELLRSLGPHSAAHLRVGAAEAAATAAALLRLRDSSIRSSLNRGALALGISATGPERVTFAYDHAPTELAPLVGHLAAAGLKLVQLGRAPSITPFGAFLAAVRRAKGAPAPSGPEIAAFKASFIKMSAGREGAPLRATLGRGMRLFKARKQSRHQPGPLTAPPAPTPAEDLDLGGKFVTHWASGSGTGPGFTLAALAYASTLSSAAGPGPEACPSLRGYGLVASFDWFEVGRGVRRPCQLRAPAGASAFLGSFVCDSSTGVVYMVARRPAPQAFPPPAAAAPAGHAPADPPALARLARTPSAGIQHPDFFLL